ncbi:MAG: hypothetical protein WCL51_08240 [Bacteroidota bacterium]
MKYLNSKNLAILISFFIFSSHLYFYQNNYGWKNTLSWDVVAYYLYLPETIIHHDPGLTDQNNIKQLYDKYNLSKTQYQIYKLPNGNWSTMYSIGFAFLFLPFFLIGHIWALLSHYPPDGFSLPYQIAISNGVMIYIIAGIFVLRKLLKKFFDDKVTSLVMIFLLLGTNYFHEAAIGGLMPHATLFTAFCLIIYLSIRWHETLSMKTAFGLGLLLGLTILARASSIFIVLFPLLWMVYDKESLMNKIKLLSKNYKQILIGLIGLCIFPIFQLIFWKITTGKFFFNTYQVTPGFDWLNPQFSKLLLSYKKGWLLYTPMMIFALAGIYFVYKNNKNIRLSIILYTVSIIYLLACWGTWWGGGSMGHRYFVESYAVFCLPFGYFIQWFINRKYLKYVFIIVCSTFLFYNLFQTWQFNNWVFDGYSMTKDYYWKIFLKTNVSKEDLKYKEIISEYISNDKFNNPEDYNKFTVGYLDFDSINTTNYKLDNLDTSITYSKPYSYKIKPDYVYGPCFKLPFNLLTKKGHVWLKISMWYYPVYSLKEAPVTLVAVLDHNNGQYNERYTTWDLEKFPYELNKWNYISVTYLTPYPLSRDKDVIKIYPYLRGNKEIYIDNFQVVAYERKW